MCRRTSRAADALLLIASVAAACCLRPSCPGIAHLGDAYAGADAHLRGMAGGGCAEFSDGSCARAKACATRLRSRCPGETSNGQRTLSP